MVGYAKKGFAVNQRSEDAVKKLVTPASLWRKRGQRWQAMATEIGQRERGREESPNRPNMLREVRERKKIKKPYL